MKDVKSTARDIDTGVKKGMREVDGHTPSDDIGNAGDDIRKGLGNAGDRVRESVDRARDNARHDQQGERVVRRSR